MEVNAFPENPSTWAFYMNKIFGIGMPKTGTTSLHHALELLGYRSIHFPRDELTVSELEAGNYRLTLLNEYDALSDVPIPAIFAQLDHFWPDSKFVLTVRNLDSWLDSCANAPFNAPESIPKKDHFRYFYRSLLYGCISFNRERFAWVYQNHIRTVTEYFAEEKTSQLLIMDLAAGDGWDELCRFLNVEKPQCEFPHSNPRQDPEMAYQPFLKRIRRKLSLK